MTAGDWFTELEEVLPKAPIVRELVNLVEALPSMNAWEPEHGLRNNWRSILHWGFPLYWLKSATGIDLDRQRLAESILASGKPSLALLAEMSAAALCSAFGATSCQRIQTGKNRTADWRVEWPDGSVDVEVSSAAEKREHRRLREAAQTLVTVLHDSNQSFDLIVDVLDPTDQMTREALVAASRTIKVGELCEQEGRWRLVATTITREPEVVIAAGSSPNAKWWPPTKVKPFVVHQMVAGPNQAQAPPQTRVGYHIDYGAYLNPLSNKADRPQGTGESPFLIALDTERLPGALSHLPSLIQERWPQWPRIGGVLLFHQVVAGGWIGWTWRLLANPHASHPLPAGLTADRLDHEQAMDLRVSLIGEPPTDQ